MTNRSETMQTVKDYFLGLQITADGDYSHEIKRHLLLGRKAMTNLDSILKSRDTTLPSSQSYGFSSSHVQMWELDYKENWVLKNWCLWTVVLEKTLESPLDCKEIQPDHSEYQPWDFFGGNDAKAETPVLWPIMRRVDSLEKTLMLGGIGGKRRRGRQRTSRDVHARDGWMASLTRWMWLCVNSGSWWWTGRPGVLRFMGSQRVGHDWATDLIWSA